MEIQILKKNGYSWSRIRPRIGLRLTLERARHQAAQEIAAEEDINQ